MATIRLKPHLAPHVLSDREVALLSESGRYALRGEAYAAVVPLLDGRRSDDEIAAELAGRVRPELVHYALIQLQAKGYAEAAADPSASSETAAWWSGHGVVPEVAEETIAACPVYLGDAGAPGEALACLREMLDRRRTLAGAPAPDGLAIFAACDYLDPRLAAAVREAAAVARWTLPVRLAGPAVWLGPLIEGDDAARFSVLLRRLADNRPADATAVRHGAPFPILRPQGLPESFAFAAAGIASAVNAILCGAPPPGLAHGVITLDPWALEGRVHPVVAVSGASLAAAPEPGSERAPIELSPNPKRHISDGGHRICSPGETVEHLQQFIGDIGGIVPDIQKAPAPHGMHVYLSAGGVLASDGMGHDHRANRVRGRAGGAAGKGASDLQARASCLAEAVERYSCGFFGDEPRRRARLADLGDRALAPDRLMLYSDAQYAARESFNAGREGFNWIAAPFDPTRETDWTPAWSLSRERTVWIPTAFCYFGYANPPDHDFCRADSNGCAAGNTIEEAILQGFLELVERDACALWWYNRTTRPAIDLESFADPFLDATLESYRRSGRALAVLDLTSDLEIPTAMAVSWRDEDGGRIHLGLGCHLDPRIAVSRALAELNQGAAYELASPEAVEPVPSIDSDYARWLRDATVENQPYLLPAAGPPRKAGELDDLSARDIRDDILRCVDLLAAKRLEMIVLEHTRPDIGFPVARVVVPGLRHFWARFAPGRLYDVPVELGWRERPCAESELNPIPFFL